MIPQPPGTCRRASLRKRDVRKTRGADATPLAPRRAYATTLAICYWPLSPAPPPRSLRRPGLALRPRRRRPGLAGLAVRAERGELVQRVDRRGEEVAAAGGE